MVPLPKGFDLYPENLKSEFLRFKKIVEDGGRIVGTACSYAPAELIIAAGGLSIPFASTNNDDIAEAEKRLPKNICPLVAATYGAALSDTSPVFYYCEMGLVESSCDERKKMYEKLNELKPVHTMHLPQGIHVPGAFDYWYSELLNVKEVLEKAFDTEITDEKLSKAINLKNRERIAAKELYDLGKLSPCPIPAEDFVWLSSLQVQVPDVEERIACIKKKTEELKHNYEKGENKKPARPRILVTGCPLSGVKQKILSTLDDSGVEVVAIENCSCMRERKDLVDENKPPLIAIAEKYLKIPCAVMTPNPARIESLDKYIRDFKVDGVVEVILQTCYPFAIETDINKRFVSDEMGIPYMSIETNYATRDFGQISTRIEAFAEMLKSNFNEMTP